jgi:hypothetical protein
MGTPRYAVGPSSNLTTPRRYDIRAGEWVNCSCFCTDNSPYLTTAPCNPSLCEHWQIIEVLTLMEMTYKVSGQDTVLGKRAHADSTPNTPPASDLKRAHGTTPTTPTADSNTASGSSNTKQQGSPSASTAAGASPWSPASAKTQWIPPAASFNLIAKTCGSLNLTDQRGMLTKSTNSTYPFKTNGCRWDNPTRVWFTTEYVLTFVSICVLS